MALVTGGARGIGRAIAEALAEVGADVAAVDVAAPNETLATVEALGRRGLALQADVRSRAEVVVFLASQISNYATGQTLNVDGGILMD